MAEAAETAASKNKHQAYLTCCLCIDLIGSTTGGLTLTSRQLDRLNAALVEQIAPHLEQLGLKDVLSKFTGDGWLLLAHGPDRDAIASLCCLATIMAHRFAAEMADRSRLAADRIPRLRLALGAGFDLLVTLPNGQADYVGDSARRAVRALGYRDESCDPAEILVCDVIRQAVMRDFVISQDDVTKTRPKPEKVEEVFPLYVLGELRPEAAADFDAPDYYAYTLAAIGKAAEATQVLEQAAEETAAQCEPELATAQAATLVRRWNQVIAGATDYATAVSTFNDMRSSGSLPDMASYAALIHKTPDFGTACALLETMQKAGLEPTAAMYNAAMARAKTYGQGWCLLERMSDAGLEPNAATYNVLISKAESYEQAESLLQQMQDEELEPNAATYNTLISRAGSFAQSERWLQQMQDVGLEPNAATYSMLVSRAESYQQAERWMQQMQDAGLEPNAATYNTLLSRAESYEQEERALQRMQGTGLKPNAATYNALIYRAESYELAAGLLQQMQDVGLEPNAATYNALMHSSESHEQAAGLLQQMQHAGLEPNIATYNMLISRAESCEQAEGVVQQMRNSGLEPDAATYNALMYRAESYELAVGLLQQMQEAGLNPTVATYSVLIGKARTNDQANHWLELMLAQGLRPSRLTHETLLVARLSCRPAAEVLQWYWSWDSHPPSAVSHAITFCLRRSRVTDALTLSLYYPYLAPAHKTMREHPEEALAAFRAVPSDDPAYGSAQYALGECLRLLGRPEDARPHYEKALDLAETDGRREAVEKRIRELEAE